jgi:hypothetical protein
VRRADNLATFVVPIVLKSGSLTLLEPSGTAKACNGIALSLPVWSKKNNATVIKEEDTFGTLAMQEKSLLSLL